MAANKTAPSIGGGNRRLILAILVGNGLLQAAGVLAITLLDRLAFDRLIRATYSPDKGTALLIGSGLTLAAVSIAYLKMRAWVDAERLGLNYAHRVRMALFDRLVELSPRTLQRRGHGAVMLRFVGDLTALRRWVSLGLARLVVAGLTSLFALVALSYINLVLAGTVGFMLASAAVATAIVGTLMPEAVKESRRRRAYLAANVNEKIASTALVQVFDQARRERRRLTRQGRRLTRAMVKRASVTARLRAITEGTATLSITAVLLAGANEVASGRATAGAVVAAMVIVRLLAHSFRDLGRVHEYWHAYRVSIKKMKEFLDTPAPVTEIRDAPDLPQGPGGLEFENVSVKGLFQDIHVVADGGERIAIVGPSGAGKSTMLLLAARLMDPDEGKVLMDGADLKLHNLSSVRHAVGMVSPELPLLKGTVEKNLRYRNPQAPAEEVERVIQLCGLDEVFGTLPEGRRTRLVERAANLPTGARHRLALARALLGNPRILLLDEAETNHDLELKRIIDQIIREYCGTVLMVTDRHERISTADSIWHIRDGRLLEAGPPSKLLRGSGPTAYCFGAAVACVSSTTPEHPTARRGAQ